MKLSVEEENKLNKLADGNEFFRSLYNQYNDKQSLTEKQIECIKKQKT